ncbi:hypothetical protein [Rheinheimera sp. UJ63]|uniref:hypothetical protein n=1 Tax=Rheinheimera sp. UJ63 TaxID=2910157 RepID=UPI001F2962BA|nr:hypothetical protein [Rheinheimera sp. UJ63]MCF4010437.1 hypothetical protein [Rheinheimera sp. UJ63]
MRGGSAERVTSSPWAGKIERAFAATWVAFSLVTFFWRDKRKLLANGEKVFNHMIIKRLKSQAVHYHFRKAKESKSLANGEKAFNHMISKRLKSQTMHYYFRKAKESKSLANGEKVFNHMINKRLKSQTMHYYFRKAKESKSLANGEKVINYTKLQPGEAAWFNTRLHRRRIKANHIKNSTLTTVLILNKAL